MNLEKVDRDEDSFEVLQYRKNHIYVNDGRVKGYSVNNQSKVGGEYSILSDIAELFRVRYSLKKIRSGSYDVLVGKGEGHVIRIVDTGEKYSLQFFEPDFYTEEISKGQ